MVVIDGVVIDGDGGDGSDGRNRVTDCGTDGVIADGGTDRGNY